MSEQAPHTPNDQPLGEIVQQEYANGVNHLYELDAEGKKQPISYDAVAEAYGHTVGPVPQVEEAPEAGVEAPAVRDKQAELRAHAQWKQKVNTMDRDSRNSRDFAKQGISGEDVAYGDWLKENAADDHAGESLNNQVKAEAQEAADAERQERLRGLAALEMRVKTGAATGEEAAYYYTMMEKAEEEPAQEAADAAEANGDHRGSTAPEPVEDAPEAVEEEPVDDAAEAGEEAAEADAPESEGEDASVDDESQEVPAVDPNAEPEVEDDRSEEEIESRRKNANETRQEDMENLAEARDNYAQLVAGRSRRSLTIGKYSAKKVQEAREEYENLLNDILEADAEFIADVPGVTAEMIDGARAVHAFGEARQLARTLHNHRMVATGNFKFNENGDIEAVKKGIIGRQMNKFYNWFGSVNTDRGRFSTGAIKKGLAVAGIGIGTGAVVGLLAPAVAGVAALGGSVLIANRITKAYMSTRLHRKGEDAVFANHGEARLQELYGKIGNGTNGVEMTDVIDTQSKTEVKRNRRRMALTVGATAVAGIVGGELVQHFAGIDHVPGNGSGNHTPNHTPGNNGTGTGHNGTPNHPGKVDGFKEHVNVEAGHGYTQELQDLFQQKGINLSGQQSFDLYNHLAEKFPKGHFFTNDPSYNRGSDFGISHSGSANWDPRVLEEVNRWAQENSIS